MSPLQGDFRNLPIAKALFTDMKPTTRHILLCLLCLALLISGGCSDAPDGEMSPERALEEVRRMAEQGDALAQHTLGVAYEHGSSVVPQDREEAVRWYRKAAEQGLDIAQVRLGRLYHRGTDGVLPGVIPQDRAEGNRWLRKAAEQGNTQAIMLLRVAEAMEKEEGKQGEKGDEDEEENEHEEGEEEP